MGCPSGADAPSHQIPKNPALFNKWKSMIFSEKIQHMTDEQISKCVVCYRHFANDDYLVTFRVRKLKRGIAPSLNLPKQSAIDYTPIQVEVKEEIEVSDDSTSEEKIETEVKVSKRKGTKVKMQEAPRYSNDVGLFEDLPEMLGPVSKNLESWNLLERSPDISLNERQIISTTKTFKSSREKMRKSKRKRRARLTAEQLILFQRKKQAEQYAKTPTVQKLLSYLTHADRSLVQSRIRKSKYSPRMYIKVYHDIAQRKALGQL